MHAMVTGHVLASRCEAPGEAVSGFMAAGVALLLLEHPEKYRSRVDASGNTCLSTDACQCHSGWGLSSAYCFAGVRWQQKQEVPVSGGAPTPCAKDTTEASCGI